MRARFSQVYFSDSRMQLPPLTPALQERRAAARDACLAAGVAWAEEEDELAGGCRGVDVAYFAGAGAGRRRGLAPAKGTLGVMKGFSAAVAATVESDGDADADDGSGPSSGVSGARRGIDGGVDAGSGDAAEFYWGGKRAVRAAREAAAAKLL